MNCAQELESYSDLRGRPADVLEKLASLDLDTPQTEALNLKSLISLLEQCFRVQSGLLNICL